MSLMRNLSFLLIIFMLAGTASAQTEMPDGTVINSSRTFNWSGAQSNINTPTAMDQLRAHEQDVYRQFANLNVTATVGLDYDIKYYMLDMRINPDTAIGKYIKGSVKSIFKTLTPNFTVLKFDFATSLVCDSVYYHGAKLDISKISEATADVLEITLPAIAAAGTLDSVKIYYQGVPPNVAGFSNGTGFVKSTHVDGASVSHNYVYTLSEPYSSFTWWPCKSMVANDKADSLDITVSNPVGFRCAANGVRTSETTVGSDVITKWRHRHPISSYQVCVAVANYDQYPVTPDLVNIGGTNMPYYNLIFPETNTAISRGQLDKTKIMLTTFSSKFGDYPFKDEKYGNYTFGFSGGMEHNTFSGMNPNTYNTATAWDVNAHELGHQWFGASVTCGSWKDIWVNESFATYTEIVCAEFAPSITSGATGLSWRIKVKNAATSASSQSQSTSVSDTSTILSIFTPAVYVYERGAMTISMLRTMLGDTKFFQTLKNYQSDPLLKNGNAYTADVKRHFEATSGLNLTTFFNQWINYTGYAKYTTAQWNNSGRYLVMRFVQTPQSSTLTHFDMPLSVHIKGANAGEDTTVVIYDEGGTLKYMKNGAITDNAGGSIIQYNLSFTPTTVLFDDSSKVMATATMVKNTGLALLATNIISFAGDKQQDGDVKLSWTIDNAAEYNSFEIERSADGRTFYSLDDITAGEHPAQRAFTYLDAQPLTTISYYRIKLTQKDGTVIYTRIIAIAADMKNGIYSITPNPAKEFILIKSQAIETTAAIRLVDVQGKQLKQLSNQKIGGGNTIKMIVSNLPAGTYFVEIDPESGKPLVKKIVVIK